jgi:hypothetical protein
VTVQELGELLIWLGAIAGALLAIGTVLRLWVVNPLKRNTNVELQSVKANVAKVLAEIAPENGVRMGERLNGVELRLAAVETRVGDHITTHGKLG